MVNTQFHEYVSMLLKETGHMVTSEPIYINHTASEALYIDSEKNVTVTRFDRTLLQRIENVSLLVELKWPEVIEELSETVQIYSVTVDFSERNRSQLVADIHHLLYQYWSCDHSVVFFKNRDQYIISFADKDQSHVLSDWFDIDVDHDDRLDWLNIGCISLVSSNDYFTDFIYAVARPYYTYPVSFENASYGMMPRDYIKVGLDAGYGITKEDVKTLIRSNMAIYESQYGTDYVAPSYAGKDEQLHYHNITAELDRISFEIELADDAEDDEQIVLFGFDSDDNEFVEDDEFLDDFGEDIDEAIFDDPALMVKWLERSQKQLDYGEVNGTLGLKNHNHQQFEAEQREKAHIEAERLERERIEAEHREKARIEAERLEQERIEADRREKARIEAERLEQERIEAERREKARIEAERLERERIEAERREKARIEAERLAQKKREAERQEQQRLEVERRRRERAEAERLKREQLEAERRERIRLEAERKEQERIEAKRREKERLEAERLKREQLKEERREQERIKQARIQQQLFDQITAHHRDAQESLCQKYDSDLAQLRQELEVIDATIHKNNARLQQLSFLQFLEKRTIKAEQEALTSKRESLNKKITEVQSEYSIQCDTETKRFNEQMAQHGFALSTV